MSDSKRLASRHRTSSIVSAGHGRFRPRARLIRTIGAELISSEIVAILELVRNSYDADASHVEIRFNNPTDPRHASLEIRDNGHGMTKEVLLGPWLEPATDHKATQSRHGFGGDRSPRGRRRLGSKGVGRFAAQRLGHHLRVRTRSRGASTHLEADFAWQQLDTSEQYLDELSIPWRELRQKRRSPVGTCLFITVLRDAWNEARFEQLRLGLSRLLGPGLGDDRFSIVLVIDAESERVRPFVDALRPMYSVSGEVKIGGRVRMTYRDISGTRETWHRSVLWPISGLTSGGFHFRINAWDLDRDAIEFFTKRTGSRLGLRDLRRLIRDHSGITLYRDGFRILPYGEPDNDWLRLDRRRVNNPTVRLSNNQVMGCVQITAEGNPHLKDQTNREGLVSNEAHTHLQQVLIEILTSLEVRRFAARRSMPLASRQKATSLPVMSSASRIDELVGRFASARDGGQEHVEALKEALRGIHEGTSETVRRYAGLAATGQLATLVVSRLEHPLDQLGSEVKLLAVELKTSDTLLASRDAIEAISERMERRLGELRRILARLDPLARPRGGRRLLPVQLEDCVSDVAAIYSDKIGRAQIDFQLVPDGRQSVLSDLCVTEQVLAILFDNAVYWLSKVKPPRTLRATLRGKSLILENNGPAIEKAHASLIFDPHFTTREDASGMGLALARDLLESVGGKLVLKPRRRGATFELSFSR